MKEEVLCRSCELGPPAPWRLVSIVLRLAFRKPRYFRMFVRSACEYVLARRAGLCRECWRADRGLHVTPAPGREAAHG